MQSLGDLMDKIRSLESERSHLEGELENLKKAAKRRAAILEEDVAAIREEIRGLREVLGSDVEVTPLENKQEPRETPPVQIEASDLSIEEPAIETTSPTLEQPELNSVIETLSDEERKIIDVLKAHDGKYPQKNIRTEAKLNWLQANRLISKLTERGIVSMEKDGVLNVIALKEPLIK